MMDMETEVISASDDFTCDDFGFAVASPHSADQLAELLADPAVELALDDASLSPTGRALYMKVVPAKAELQKRGLLSYLEDAPIAKKEDEIPPTQTTEIPALIELPKDFATKSPPSYSFVEEGVLGCLIINPEAIAEAASTINASDFSSAERMRLFSKLCDLSSREETITPIVIQAEFHASGMSSLAAHDLIQNAIAKAAPVQALPKYYGILRDYSRRRVQMITARQLYSDAIAVYPSAETVEKARAALDGIEDRADLHEAPDFRFRAWPAPIDDLAYHGLAGDLERLIAPRTEADPVAILGQFLVCFGNAIGRKVHWAVDASRHYCNEYLVICGLTAKGRKGTSWDIIKLLFEKADPNWATACEHTGIASGEGLILTVRDAKFSKMKLGSEMHETLEEAGVDDKRSLWIEDEFQGVLAVMQREGSNLSANLRKAWQSGKLENANKNSPLRSTNAHISLIGHITCKELSRSLGNGEIGNGFANRFLWIAARRSKLLPRGGNLLSKEMDLKLAPIVERLQSAMLLANDDLRSRIPIDFADDAWRLWDETYSTLSRTRLGRVGEVTDRAEAHVRRLAVIYALLEQSKKVELAHLKAALALWDYCERSAQFIFGDGESDPMAEKIYTAIEASQDAGISQTALCRKLFSGRKSQQMNAVLESLVSAGLVKQVERVTGGRKAMIWVQSA